jgi:hypothetical protein
MRWIPGAAADRAIVETLSGSDVLPVRTQAAAALAYRQTNSNRDALLKVSKSGEPAMRIACLNALSSWMSADEKIADRIQEALDDPDEGVRKLAQDLAPRWVQSRGSS